MKRCPQCNSLYEDKTQFCLNDGQPLVEDGFTMPSDDDDEETIIRHDPITIDFSAPPETPQVIYQTVPVEIEKESKSRNQLLYLLVGLLAGGGLVLAAVFLTMNFSRSNNNNEIATNKPANIANVQTPKPVNSPANQNAAIALNIHEKPNPTANENELNGRVISSNAYIRSAPNSDASIIDTLPVDDRLNISRRAAPNSPWYQVTCEHGTNGWMHGNTIEFTKDNF